MPQAIRQQTHTRSPLLVAAERSTNTPRRYKTRKPAPLSFLIDGTSCVDETLVYPRTTRQAFGHYAADPAPSRITFLQHGRTGWVGIAAVLLLLASVIFWSAK